MRGFVRGVHFQGLLRRCAPRAAASGGANRHPRIAVRSPLLCRSDVVLPLKAQPKKKRNANALIQGLLRPFGARAAASGGANRHPRARRTLLAECVHFQGLLRSFGARAAASGGANRHPRKTFRSPLLCRSDVVLPLKAQPKKKRNAEAFLIFLGALSGTRTLGPLIKSQLLYQLS